jgi:Flp pilus assembly protein TadB
MDQRQPKAPSEERRSEPAVIEPGHEQAQPKLSDAYVSFWISRESDDQPGRRVRPILLAALFGLASAAAVVVLVALALMSSPLVGFLSAVAMFAIIRHAQFRRVRRVLVRGERS